MRAGGNTLTLLGAPRTFLVLQALADGAKGRFELRRAAGSPAETTLRGHLGTLEQTGAMVKRRRDAFPGALEYELTDSGRELLVVAECLERWLADAPSEPLELGRDQARAAVKGLVDGWSATVLSALAASPLSLTELDKQIPTTSYPAIERCLETMRLAELLEVGTRGNRGTPHKATDWLRRGLAPLALGARWEHRHGPEGAAALCGEDVADAFAIAGPLLELPAQLSGICQLAVKASDKEKQRFLGSVEVKDGEIAFGAVYPQSKPDAWMAGTVDVWFASVIDADAQGLKQSGDRDLAQAVLEHMHRGLFANEAVEEGSEARAQG